MSSNLPNENSDNSWTPLFDRFNQTLRTEVDALFKHLSDGQTNLINECDGLRKEIKLLRQEKDEMAKLLKKYDNIVILNIGGQLFSTTIETITKEECLFTKMFSGRYNLREQQGAVFIDRDPTHFRILLNYLRTNTFIEPKSAQDRTELLLEAEYYQITSLVKQLQDEIPTNMLVVEKLLFDSTLHHPQVTISEGGIKASYSLGCAKCIYAKIKNILWTTGRHYWEITLETDSGGGCYSSMGIATSSWNGNKRLGDDSLSWALRLCNGDTRHNFSGLRHNEQSTPYYNKFPKGTRVGALLDLNQGTVEYVINGVKRGIAFTNLKGHAVTPVFEFCCDTIYRMNHDAIAPVV